MRLYGKNYTRREIEQKVPDIRQICGTRQYELTEGATRGTRVVDVNTGILRYSVVLDRGMDISLADYKGINLTHLTENGEVHPAFYESVGMEWARIFFGGLMTTCGMTYLGPPGRDGTEELGLHGRYSAIPARRVKDLSDWHGDEYEIILAGEVKETVQMGTKMRMERRITSTAGKAVIHICDRVTNTGTSEAPFTILYHINFGFPLLDSGTRIILQSREIIPFDEYSGSRQKKMFCSEEPRRAAVEENYFCLSDADAEGKACAMLVNDRLMGGIGVYIKVSVDTLPYFCEWKMMDERDYIIALEPANVICENRGILRKRGMLPILQSGESRTMDIEIGVLEGEKEISFMENALKNVIAL
ncbi:MAG: aldose 1-epimerase family protein [Eubacteriales bacterium]|nr:aldose 1-epimerase family protein [Eubacteriales bacterium]